MIGQDLAYSARTLLRKPALLLSAVLALGLGIGANGTMLGVLDTLLLRFPAHVQDPTLVERLYLVDPSGPAGPQSISAYPTFTDLAGSVKAFKSLAAYVGTSVSVGRSAAARQVPACLVTSSFLPLLGVVPVRGRLFTEAEGDPEHPGLVAMVSWELWHRAFAGTPEILGKSLAVGKDVYSVVGVLPRGFTGIDLTPIDVWLPIGAAGSLWAGPHWSTQRNNYFVSLVARLRRGASIAAAEEQASAALGESFANVRSRSRQRVVLGPVQQGRSPDNQQQARLAEWLGAMSAAVLLIACLNVASLLIVRTLERRRELAVRLALGAGRARLIRLLLLESLVLALLGGLAAYAVSRAGNIVAATYLLPVGTIPTSFFDLRSLLIFILLGSGAWLLTGVGPALWAGRYDLTATMKAGGHEGAPGRSRLRRFLLAAQVALTVLLLIGAGLLVQSLRNVRRLHLGLDTDHTLVATLDLASMGYTPSEVEEFYASALGRLRHLVGATRVSLATGIPFQNYSGTSLEVPGLGPVNDLASGGVSLSGVAGSYFTTVGTTLRLGRTLTDEDSRGRERLAVLNETAAHLLWPDRSPLGRCIVIGSDKNPCATIVGVVEDSRRSQLLPEKPSIQVFIPLFQTPAFITSRALFVRAAGDSEIFARAVRREIQAVAPNLPYIDVEPLGDLVEPQIRPWKMGATLLSIYGALALVLAAVGIFAAIAYAVESRRYELGVRIALGALPRNLILLVMKDGFLPAVVGAAAGLLVAAFTERYIAAQLYGIAAGDSGVRVAVIIASLTAAFVASYLPGLRVRQIDPADAMRRE